MKTLIKFLLIILIITIRVRFAECICKSSDDFMVSPYCSVYYQNKSVNLQSDLWPVIGITTFKIDEAIKKTLFLPEICREAMTPFICASGYNECTDETDIPRPPCRSICKNVHDKCSEYFEANNIELPDCYERSNVTGLELYPVKGYTINITSASFTQTETFVPCFDVDLTQPAPVFPYDCPFPFVTTNDGCEFQCPAPVTDDPDLQEIFENFYLWSRRTSYITIYVLGILFFILQLSTHQIWFSISKIFALNLHFYILIASVWNLFGMESSSFPVCHSKIEVADIEDSGCVAQAFYISTFAGIACMYFFMTLKVMYEVGYGGLARKQLPKWIVYFGLFLGFLCQFFPAILIVTTHSYQASALACITDYEITLWGMPHFPFWIINGAASFFVFMGFLFSLITVYRVLKITFSSQILMNEFNLKSIWKLLNSQDQQHKQKRRLVIFIIVFGAIIQLAQSSTLTGVRSEEFGKGAQKWVICVITNFINSKSFDTKYLPQPQCIWDPKPNLFLVAYGVFSPTLFEFVYIIILWGALKDSLKKTFKKLSASLSTRSSSNSHSNSQT